MLASAVASQFWAFLLAGLLLGLGSGTVSPAIRRIVITRDPEHVGNNLGRLAAFDLTGFVLGPLVAALAAELLGIRDPSGSWRRFSSRSSGSRSASICRRAP